MNQMLSVCPNLEHVGVVVCWFADSLDIKNCSIFPAVEYGNSGSSTSQEWRVAAFSRSAAKVIGMEGSSPRYGGTINDASLVCYIKELNSKGLMVSLYPMFLLDLPGKPWRGHISGSASDVAHFFEKGDGYNNFILHYANLAKDLVDCFVIGSELKGITAIHDQDYNFPAVDELVNLAEKVKNIVGSKTCVTYAADWSEYHHTERGWFHLDKLWACHAIDVIGIDAYFPITNTSSMQITDEEILQGWDSGEGFDYYISEDGAKIALDKTYAWKNIEHWWSSYHTNPDGKKTPWLRKMKKIWFTEFGYPSIDKASNQPNVFFDPNCIDGNVPKSSNGKVDLSIQRRCIKLAIQRWQESSMVERMYLWTWDARPYPAWPRFNVWRDSHLWQKGHWVNGKFGLVSLAGIIAEICERCGIPADNIDVSSLDIAVEGVVFNKSISAFAAIGILRCCYFFDIYQREDILVFQKRGSAAITHIDHGDLVRPDRTKGISISESIGLKSINQISISFINQTKKYAIDSAYTNLDLQGSGMIQFLNLPIVMQESQARAVAEMIIASSRVESRMLQFALPTCYLYLCPSDIICLNLFGKIFSLRIIEISFASNVLKVTALPEDSSVYQEPLKSAVLEIAQPERAEE
jgi:hypothetical protein